MIYARRLVVVSHDIVEIDTRIPEYVVEIFDM